MLRFHILGRKPKQQTAHHAAHKRKDGVPQMMFSFTTTSVSFGDHVGDFISDKAAEECDEGSSDYDWDN
jgi:hypothetical protein